MKGEISRTCVIKTVEEYDKWRDTLKTSVDNDIDTTVSYEHGLWAKASYMIHFRLPIGDDKW